MSTNTLMVFSFLAASLAQGAGREVFVAVGREGGVRGELVTLTDSTLVVAPASDPEEQRIIPIRDVQWVKIRGERYVTEAAVVGAVVCGFVGGVVGASTIKEPIGSMNFEKGSAAVEGALIGTAAGLAIGYGIGSALSSKDVTVAPEDSNFRQVLQSATRNVTASRTEALSATIPNP